MMILKPHSCKGMVIWFYPSGYLLVLSEWERCRTKYKHPRAGKNSSPWTQPNSHLCRPSATKPKLLWVIIGANEPLLSVWVDLCSIRTCRRSICLHAEHFRRPIGIFHALYSALLLLHKIIISSPDVCFFPTLLFPSLHLGVVPMHVFIYGEVALWKWLRGCPVDASGLCSLARL